MYVAIVQQQHLTCTGTCTEEGDTFAIKMKNYPFENKYVTTNMCGRNIFMAEKGTKAKIKDNGVSQFLDCMAL